MTQTVVEVLRSALERAERGEITGVAIATTHGDLFTGNAWSMEKATLVELLGSAVILQGRLTNEASRPSAVEK